GHAPPPVASVHLAAYAKRSAPIANSEPTTEPSPKREEANQAVTRPPPKVSRHESPEPETPSASAPVAEEDPVGAEIENLTRIRSLGATDPAKTLALAEEGHRRFSKGLLSHEREALAISALVRLGRTQEA